MSQKCFTDLTASQMQTFCLVMREGGYAAAASVSHLSVPSIWQHIRSMERVYATRLFRKVGRNVVPTAEAKLLFDQLEPMMAQLESTLELVSQDTVNRPIRLVVGTRMLMEDLSIPLARFQEKHPQQIRLLQGLGRRAEELILSDQADLAASLEPSLRDQSSKIQYEPAYTVEFIAVSPKEHPYAKARSGGLRELAKHDLITAASGTHGRQILDDAFHRGNLKPNIVVETDNSAFTIVCVQQGMGVGVLAGRREGHLCQNLATRSLSKPLGRRRIMLMHKKGRLLSEPLQDLVKEIQRFGRE